mmetsp:Transcript_21243/g.46449  ORF Transcript_21243/g.46449 Transcript_21243/m.46449 type:complete len:89 (-) Transcript_21243:115-381(-)
MYVLQGGQGGQGTNTGHINQACCRKVQVVQVRQGSEVPGVIGAATRYSCWLHVLVAVGARGMSICEAQPCESGAQGDVEELASAGCAA